MKHNYYINNRNHSPIQNKNSVNWRLHFTMLFSLFFILVGYAQKGKNDVILHTCIQVLENGLIQAQFGYTNPTNKDITVGEDESVVFISDKDDDDEINGIRKEVVGVTFLADTTDENVFSVTFNSSGHAKWTVTFGNKETKIRATAASTVCVEPCVVCPVFGGAGKAFGPLWPDALALATGNAGEDPSELIFQFNDQEDEVLVEIVPRKNIVPTNGYTQEVLDLLTGTFGRQTADFIVNPITIIEKEYATIDVYMPISELINLSLYGDDEDLSTPYYINFIRALHPAIIKVGAVDSQGDGTMLTNIVRESFVIEDEFDAPIPVDGSGIKVGIISDSWGKVSDQAASDVVNGDLPGPGNPNDYLTAVDVRIDLPGIGRGTDEGRAMGQIVHDVAPRAALGFSTGVRSPRDMALAIDNFASATPATETTPAILDYDIITDDVTYPLGPFFEDGEIAQAVKKFTELGGTYVTAAGNFYDNAHVGNFVNSGESVILPDFLSAGTKAHVFDLATQDITQAINLKIGTYYLVLQWDQPLASQDNSKGADTDLDIYVLNNSEQVLVNTNWENLEGDGLEAIVFQSFADDAPANIMITSANGPAPNGLAFRYIIFKANGLEVLEHKQDGAPTVSGQGMSTKAITVGAVDYTEVPLPLDESAPLDIEPRDYSSHAGNRGDGTTLLIDIMGPDGVEVNLPGFSTDEDGDGFDIFKGTSAAAPHVAGAFALLKSAQASWYPVIEDEEDPKFPGGLPIDALLLFQENTTPVIGSVDQVGSGLINVEKAFRQIAAQTAVLTGLVVNEGQVGELGNDPLNITITGNYIPDDPTVYLGEGDGRIELDLISSTETEIEVTVPPLGNLDVPIIDNPDLVVYTTPITNGETDGGDSKPIKLFGDDTIVLNLIAEDLPGEVGEPITYGDSFTYTYRVEGLPEGLEIDDLPPIILTSGADDPTPDDGIPHFPNVNNYVIFPEFDRENASDEQKATLDTYRVIKVRGLLRITQKELTITPKKLEDEPEYEFTYGEAIILDLKYKDASDVVIGGDFGNMIKTAHETDFSEDNTLALINRFNAVVNTEVFAELQGGSWFATENTINNRFNAVVNGEGVIEMALVDLEVETLEDYLVNRFNAVVNTEINRFNAVVNGEGLFDGRASINNRFVAVVNEGSLSGDENDFNKVFAILHANDEFVEDGDDEDEYGDLDTFYALNLITGLEVTGTEEGQVPFHYSHPGAFLASIARNFIITYESSTFEVGKAQLLANLSPIESISYGTRLTPNDIVSDISGYVYGETTADVFPPDPDDESETPIIPYYLVPIIDGQVDEDGPEFELGTVLDVGSYQIKIREPKNYIWPEELGNVEVLIRELTVDANQISIEYGLTLEVEDIIKTGEGCPEVGCSVIQGFASEEAEAMFFAEFEGNPYYLVPIINGEADEEVIISLSAPLEVGSYGIRVWVPENDNYIISPSSSFGVVTVTPATLTVTVKTSPNYETNDLIIQQGETIDTSLILTTISGYKYGDTQEDVFPGGIPYIFKDANEVEVEYTEGATGVYFISIMEPQNYKIDPDPVWVLYVNPTGDHLRKIRTYLDCVEYQQGSPDGKDYIANYRYENPNDETIYIALGPENQLTGTAPYEGELPFIFLPGEGTFQIRFDGSDGKILKWELTSLDSTNKTATSSNASDSSNRCDSGNSGNEIGDSAFEISPNPTSGFVTIVQSFEGVVTLDVFDYYGILYLSIPLDGRNGPIVHEDIIDMRTYPNGMYFFRFSTNQDVQAYTVIKTDE